MERIQEIIDYASNEDTWSGVEGFEIVTNKQRIKLYIDNGQSCCESWGYFWCNDNPQEFVGTNLREVSLTDTALNTKKVESQGADSRGYGGIMFVNFDTSRGILQFVAYNSHNGYYGHTATVESEQLKHSECL